ncbi:sugar-binding protein [Candidatus Acetothermia bacterium]|nr:MAG: sugar-binding protein [Candidatus Acetothermia bacterium]RLE33347.1 MAG: sugar-binding protein [Candidatus Acetothermia bacterium]
MRLILSLLLAGFLALGGVAADKICLYFDQTGPGDLSFNDMALLGAQKAAEDFGLELFYTTASSPMGFLSDLSGLAESGEYVVIVGVGFLLFDALPEAARLYPEQKFAFVDGPNFDLPNMLGLLFREQEGGALAGVVASLVAIANGDPAVGAVAGMEIPPVWRYEAGYRFGAHWAVDWYKAHTGNDADIKVMVTYVGRFDDPAGGKVAAEALIRAGARNILGIAGGTHLGAFDAVEEAGRAAGREVGPPFAYGADAAQEYIKPGFILGSARKRVDVAVYEAVKWALGDEPGRNLVLGIKEEGTGFSTYEDIVTFIDLAVKAGYPLAGGPEEVLDKILAARQSVPYYVWQALGEFTGLLRAGEIELPEANTAEQIAEVRAEYP